MFLYVNVYFIQIYRNHENILKLITKLQIIDQNLKLQNKEYRKIRIVMIMCLVLLNAVFCLFVVIAYDKKAEVLFYKFMFSFFALIVLHIPASSEFYILIFVSIIQMYFKRLHIEMNNIRLSEDSKVDLQNK